MAPTRNILSATVFGMEAAVAEKEAGMTEWNDGRLDEFRERVDDGFAKVDKRFDQSDRKIDTGFARLDSKIDEGIGRLDGKLSEGLARIDEKFLAVNNRLDGFYRVLLQGTVAMIVGVLGLLGVVIGIKA
jgi:hypothetical protein